jgi:hypothetical protein
VDATPARGDTPFKLKSRTDAREQLVAKRLERREFPRCEFFGRSQWFLEQRLIAANIFSEGVLAPALLANRDSTLFANGDSTLLAPGFTARFTPFLRIQQLLVMIPLRFQAGFVPHAFFWRFGDHFDDSCGFRELGIGEETLEVFGFQVRGAGEEVGPLA